MLKDRWFWIIALFAFVVLLIPFIQRDFHSTYVFVGSESYLNLHLAEMIQKEKTLPRFDPLSYGGRPLTQELGLPLVLAVLPSALVRILPLLLGLLTLYLFAQLLARQPSRLRNYTLLFFVLSPPFIYLFNSISKYTLALPLFLSTLLFYSRHEPKKTLLFATLTTFGSILAGILLFILALRDYSRKKITGRSILTFFFILSGIFLYYYGRALLTGFPEALHFTIKEQGLLFLVYNFFAELGGSYGFYIFPFLLGFVGIYYTKHENYTYIAYYLLAIGILFITLYIPSLIYFLALLIAYLASVTLTTQLEEHWKSNLLKKFVITILLFGIIFSSISYLARTPTFPPNREFGAAIQWLRERQGSDTVFSHYSNGHYILYAGKKNVLDAAFLYAPNVNERWQDSQTIFHNILLKPTNTLLTKYNVRYILLDKQARKETWTDEQRELPFLLKYGKGTFFNVYENTEVTIWEVF